MQSITALKLNTDYISSIISHLPLPTFKEYMPCNHILPYFCQSFNNDIILLRFSCRSVLDVIIMLYNLYFVMKLYLGYNNNSREEEDRFCVVETVTILEIRHLRQSHI